MVRTLPPSGPINRQSDAKPERVSSNPTQTTSFPNVLTALRIKRNHLLCRLKRRERPPPPEDNTSRLPACVSRKKPQPHLSIFHATPIASDASRGNGSRAAL